MRSRWRGFHWRGLFTLYDQRSVLIWHGRLGALLEEYATRPRYMDAERDRTERPIDYLSSPIERLTRELPQHCRHPLEMIGWFLDRFAAENGRQTWAAFDLHPEFRYGRIRRRVPGAKLVVMRRDPREAIAAGLYWRGDPGQGAARDARFKHSLILYCLGLQTGSALAGRMPDDVVVLDFNALVRGDAAERGRVERLFGMSREAVAEAYGIKPDFEFDPSLGFRLPDGSRAELLRAQEFREISRLTANAAAGERNGVEPRRGFVRLARVLLAVGRLSPGTARTIADFVYYPRRSAQRRLNRLRQMAADLRSVLLRSKGAVGRGRPYFFVVSGAHGVGKSTVVEAAGPLLEEYGLAVRRFHHIMDARPAKPEAARLPQERPPSGGVWWRRLIPQPAKMLVSSARNEWNYARGIRTLLDQAASSGQVALSDRYAYDRLVDLRLHRRPFIQRAAVRIACFFMRRPTLTFLLTDEPAAIRRRKQELSETEIAWYQTALADTCARVGGPTVEVRVDGRDAASVARELVAVMAQKAREGGYPAR